MLNLLCNEAKAIIYLQNMIGNEADATEIVIFNPKNGTLRAYVEVQ